MDTEREAVKAACEAIMAYNSEGANMGFAQTYARVMLRLLRNNEPDNAVTIQANYILANLSGWRGPEATTARAALKAWVAAP